MNTVQHRDKRNTDNPKTKQKNTIQHQCNKNVKNICLSMCDVKVSLTFTSMNLVLL